MRATPEWQAAARAMDSGLRRNDEMNEATHRAGGDVIAEADRARPYSNPDVIPAQAGIHPAPPRHRPANAGLPK
jgi:hypothetical protein